MNRLIEIGKSIEALRGPLASANRNERDKARDELWSICHGKRLETLLAILSLFSDKAEFVRDSAWWGLHRILPFVGHTDTVTSIAFSPSEEWFFSGSADGTWQRWAISSSALHITGPSDKPVHSVAVALNGDTEIRVFAHGSTTVSMGPQLAADRYIIDDAHTTRSVALLPNGTKLATGRDDGTVVIYDLQTRRKEVGACPSPNAAANSVAISQNGSKVVSGSEDGTLAVFALTERDLTPLWSFSDEHGAAVRAVAFSPDGNLIASGGDDESAILWSAEDGRRLQVLDQRSQVNAVAFSSDGKTLASAGYDGDMVLWNVNDGTRQHVLRHPVPLNAVAFSPCGKTLAAGMADGTITLWNPGDGKRKSILGSSINRYGKEHGDLTATSVDFSRVSEELIRAGSTGEMLASTTRSAQTFIDAIARDLVKDEGNLPTVLNILEAAISAAQLENGNRYSRLALVFGLSVAQAYQRQTDFFEAIVVEKQVIDLAKALASPQLQWRAWHSIGQCQEELGNDPAACDAYRRAIEVIDGMWFALLEEEKLRHFFQDKAQLYDQMVLCCLRLGYDAMALEYVEKAKTRYLGDLIARHQFPRRQVLAPVLKEYWDNIAAARDYLRAGDGGSADLEVTSVKWGRPDPGSPVARPVHLAALRDYGTNVADDSSDELDRADTLPMLDRLWEFVSGILDSDSREGPDGDDKRGSLEEIRDALDAMYRHLAPILETCEGGNLPLSSSQRKAWLGLADPIISRLNSLTNDRQLCNLCWSWFERLFTYTETQRELGRLELLAVREALDAVLQHQPVRAVIDGTATHNELPQPMLETGPSADPVSDPRQTVESAAGRLSETEWQYVERMARGETASFKQIQDLIAGQPDAAILQFHVAEHGTTVYLIPSPSVQGGSSHEGPLPQRTGSPPLMVFTVADFTVNRLADLLVRRSGRVDRPQSWFVAQANWLESSRRGREDAGPWFEAMEHVLTSICQELILPSRVLDALERLQIKRLLLVPHRGLQIVPLHAAFHVDSQGSRHYVFDNYEITYAPSCTLAEISRLRGTSPPGTNAIVAINSGDETLAYADYEVAAVASHFPPENRSTLSGGDACSEKLRLQLPRTHLHDSGHATYLWDEPFDSYIELAAGERVTVGDLFEDTLQLAGMQLASLSCCETAMTNPEDVADEYIGISGGFLFAGSQAILANLWPVSDPASALLVERFFHLCLEQKRNAAAALREARQWLRQATVAEIRQVLTANRTIDVGIRDALLADYDQDAPNVVPFQHPYYWASMILSAPFKQ